MVFYRVVACGSMRSQRLFKINWKLKTENSPQSTLKIVEEDDETRRGEVRRSGARGAANNKPNRQLGTNERRSCCYCCCFCLHAAAAGRECEREQWMGGGEWGGIWGVIKESETQLQSLSSVSAFSIPQFFSRFRLSLSLFARCSSCLSPHSLWQRVPHTYEWDLCLDFSVTFWSTFPNPKKKRSSRSKRSETERNESRRNERRAAKEEREEPNEVSDRITRQRRRSKKRIVGGFPCPNSATKSGLRKQQTRIRRVAPTHKSSALNEGWNGNS